MQTFLLGTPIDDAIADVIVASIRADARPILLEINSPGGSVPAGLKIWRAMREHRHVYTSCVGTAQSMAAVLLACGRQPGRLVTEDATIMIHDVQGDYSLTSKLAHVLAVQAGINFTRVWNDMARGRTMNAWEAVGYGLADRVV